MSKRLLPFVPDCFVVEEVLPEPGRISIVCRARRCAACCPVCHKPSARLHSRYERHVADLPWQGKSVTLRFQVRRLRCSNRRCDRRIFAERAEEAVRPRRRGTARLHDIQRSVGLALGGEAGARLAARLGMGTSADTMLRIIRAASLPVRQTPRILGVDDWAWRRGQRYGTILVDLETHNVVDLLPDRESTTLAAWLETHPGTEIVARDRAGSYAQGVREGAPQARQIADRWHMLRNCSDALLDVVDRHYRLVRSVGAGLAAEDTTSPGPLHRLPENSGQSNARRRRRDSRAVRQARYDTVMALRHKGWSLSAIRRETGHDPKTLRKWLNDKRPGTWERRKPYSHAAEAFADYLCGRWDEGCRNATQLYREVCQRGYQGSAKAFRQWVSNRLRRAKIPMPPRCSPSRSWRPPSSRRTTRLLTAEPENLSFEDRTFLESLRNAAPAIAVAVHLARRFQLMLGNRDADSLDPWLDQALHSPLASFARGLIRDIDAVRAALIMPWSTGPVEGKINKLKYLKRSMYGRAGIDLLRARLVAS